MKYRTKLLTAFLVTLVVSNVLTWAIVYYVASRSLFAEIGNNALSIAATTATFVNGDEHKNIQNPGDEKTEVYHRVKETLKKVRYANHRDDTWVENVYTMKPLVEDPTSLAYGVDSEDTPGKISPVNDAIRMTKGQVPRIDLLQVDDDYSQDEHGEWLSATVPVKDSAGNVVAAVGVDLPAATVRAKLNHLLISLIGLGLVVAAASAFAVFYLTRACRPVRSLYQTMGSVGESNFDAMLKTTRSDEFGLISIGVQSMTQRLQQMEAVKSAFACYVSTTVLEKVLQTGVLPTVEADRRKITVLFSDIRDFTKISENMRPEEVVRILNEYFEKMVEVVVRYDGMVDKFIGDGLMAIFGAPEDDAFQEEKAVCAALEMQQQLRNLCKKWNAEGRHSLEIGIGINSGNAIVGNLGSAQRLEYTAVGDTVNVAARLESATKDFEADILISEYTYQGLKGSPFSITKLGATPVKGHDPVTVYTVSANSDPEAKPQIKPTY